MQNLQAQLVNLDTLTTKNTTVAPTYDGLHVQGNEYNINGNYNNGFQWFAAGAGTLQNLNNNLQTNPTTGFPKYLPHGIRLVLL